MMQPLPPAWDAERDEALVCVGVRQETHDVSTFVFAPVEPRLFRFLPGQFMTFDLPTVGDRPAVGDLPRAGDLPAVDDLLASGRLDGAGVQRCYTIASPPTRPWRIEVTAKRSPGGAGSAWLHGSMQPGMRVQASGPMGDFVLDPGAGGRYLFLSAGSGITPLMSMARTLHDLGSDADVLFLHSARSPADLLFPEELAVMARRPGFRPVSIVETDAPGARWDGLRGRLSPAMLGLLVPDLLDREVFCCGPAPYMAGVRAMLDAAGFDRARYREESFSFGEVLDVKRAMPEPSLQRAQQRGNPGATRVEVRPFVNGSSFLLPLPPGEGRSEGVLAAERSTAGADCTRSLAGKHRPAPPPHPDPLPEGEGEGSSIRTQAIALPSSAGDDAALTPDSAAQTTFTIRFARQDRDIACPGGANILAAARAAGIRLPSACGKGVCGTCKSRVLSGTVEMRHGGGIRQREIDGGMALLCCARPTSDLVVDR